MLSNDMYCHANICHKVDSKGLFQDVNNSPVVISKGMSIYPYTLSHNSSDILLEKTYFVETGVTMIRNRI